VRLQLVTGRSAEDTARRYLEAQGLRLIERNYRVRCGEIDLIMREGDYVVFVEVRYRTRADFGSGAESVNRRKQARLTATALCYLKAHADLAEQPTRFDVLTISPGLHGASVQWIQNAFEAS
jgi:TIGR00252 family protein